MGRVEFKINPGLKSYFLLIYTRLTLFAGHFWRTSHLYARARLGLRLGLSPWPRRNPRLKNIASVISR